MLHITFSKAKEAGACVESYRKLAKALGGIKSYGKDTPIPLTRVLDVCGLADTLWAMCCTIESSENVRIEIACLCAEHVLHFYEDKYPNDKRPHLSIEAGRNCINDKSAAAAYAARAAADAAEAAYAARAAEAEWQTEMLRILLAGE